MFDNNCDRPNDLRIQIFRWITLAYVYKYDIISLCHLMPTDCASAGRVKHALFIFTSVGQ